MSSKLNVAVIAILVLALIIVVIRSAASGVIWNPLGLDFGNTRPANALPEYARYALALTITALAVAAYVYAQEILKTKRARQ